MLWVVTGGVGSGKSAFAGELALTVGCEGIGLYCPTFPAAAFRNRLGFPAERAGTGWTSLQANATLAAVLEEINLESNIFRAERRVLVVDSLSGWIRAAVLRHSPNLEDVGDTEAAWSAIQSDVEAALEAICSYQGKIVVVTEEPGAGLAPDLPEQWFIGLLSSANRKLAGLSRVLYRMTAGVAMEVRGHRMNGGKSDK